MKKIIFILFVFSTIIYSQNPCPNVPTVTYQGKTYNTVMIGTQCWLKENLDIGSMIQVSQNPSNNSTIEKYCYDNKEENCAKYGGLYQWNEAMQYVKSEKAKGICPDGWHMPTYAELQALEKAVNNNSNALKAIGQGTGNGVGTNNSGFSGLLSGYRGSSSIFNDFGLDTYYWSSTEYSSLRAYSMALWYQDSLVVFMNANKEGGYNVRCAKDVSTSISGGTELLNGYSLSHNYPNPFNPNTKIHFKLSKSSHVSLRVFNLLGEEKAVLIDKELPAGSYEINFDGSDLSSGAYFYTIKAGDFEQTKKMILMK